MLAIVVVSHWFPRKADLGDLLLWLAAVVVVFYAVLIASLLLIPPILA